MKSENYLFQIPMQTLLHHKIYYNLDNGVAVFFGWGGD